MLTDEQIVALLSRDGSREDMLREAYRIGMLRAAEVCKEIWERADNSSTEFKKNAISHGCIASNRAIRAEAN